MNDPYVFKHVAVPGQERLDVTPLIENPAVILLMAERGGMVFVPVEPCCYEVHTSFLKPERGEGGQGPYIQRACLAAYRWMFTQTDCVVLQTKIPAHNRAAIVFSPLVGWVTEFVRDRAFTTLAGEQVAVNYCTIRYDDWVRKTPALEISGRAFHAQLEQEFTRFGRAEQHADDPWHDRHVGACAEMMLAGQLEKAAVLYNRWARFAGYGEIAIVSKNPPLINIGNALLQVGSDGFKVLRCL